MGDVSKRWCFAWLPKQAEKSGLRAALVKANRWPKRSVIRAGFLDGDEGVKERVRAAAKGWLGPNLAQLQIIFEDDPGAADVRISFQYDGSWSVIGTTCKDIAPDQATMNFGWLTPDSTEDEVRRVVLHEFGHALGLIHEHQNPDQGIQWNRDAVIKDLSGPPNGWDLETIERNMFQPYSKLETNFTKTDPTSIMMYPIPASWTLNGFSAGLNTSLSPTDRTFIHAQYP